MNYKDFLYTRYFHECTNYKDSPTKIEHELFNQNSIALICTLHGGNLMLHYLFGVFDKDSTFNEKEKLMPDKRKIAYSPLKLSPFNIGYYIAILFDITQTLSTTNRLFDWLFSYKLSNYTWDVSICDKYMIY